MPKHRGFTFIQFMIVAIMIIAVVVWVSIQARHDYEERAKISEARVNLSRMQGKLKQFYQDNKTYVGACRAGTGASLPSGKDALFFSYTCPPANLTANTYLVRADGNAKWGMAGFTYSVDQDGNRRTLSTGWGTCANTTCWVTIKDCSCWTP